VIPVVRGWVPAVVPLACVAGAGTLLVWLLQKVPVYTPHDEKFPRPTRIPL
jgi:UDP-GlcNAc:undecaprenyl-phosphate/decaprenyl-phosphate GlcNAc-1-phosphate transferase